jgi:hypothetical protein
VVLDANHAEIPACRDCIQWLYNPDRGWRPTLSHGQKIPRGGSRPPCWKCPKGPEPFTNEPTRTTLLVMDYYYQCLQDPAGLLPRDRRVLDNNALIARLKEQTARDRVDSFPLLLLGGLGKGKK